MDTPVPDGSRHALEIGDTIPNSLYGRRKNSNINYVRSRFLTSNAWRQEWYYLFSMPLVICRICF